MLDAFDAFDAEFFRFSPKEAAILDPQHRQFLGVREALEDGAHLPDQFDGPKRLRWLGWAATSRSTSSETAS